MVKKAIFAVAAVLLIGALAYGAGDLCCTERRVLVSAIVAALESMERGRPEEAQAVLRKSLKLVGEEDAANGRKR
jgi:hypothetical protein